jgi:hypothetical protein
MFIMLISIMIGVVLITFFVADIMRRSEIEGYQEEIQTISTERQLFEQMSRNFTDHFFKSIGSLDLSREYRAEGNTYFDLAASLWYPQGEYEKVMQNCTFSMDSHMLAYQNFLNTRLFFNQTRAFTSEERYLSIINLYMDLSQSGAKMSMLRYNASSYLYSIAENMSLYGDDVNVSELLELFNMTNDEYVQELEVYNEIIEEIESEYGKFFNPVRETP